MHSRNPLFIFEAEIKSQMPYHYTTADRTAQHTVNTFRLIRYRFHFRAEGRVRFPPGQGTNVIRGAFGWLLRESASPVDYARLFEPRAEGGPSGLADPPRPFVLRAAHLDGGSFEAGEEFSFDVHAFDVRNPTLELFRAAFEAVADKGLGPERGRALVERVEEEAMTLTLDAGTAAERVMVRFVTPTELKGGGAEFAVLFARVRDRLSTLRALYGDGPLEIDFRGMGERAREVRLVRSELEWERRVRRSSRTGQVHPIGGFTGSAEYAGVLGEFVPWLEAARWVGVGRQTVWGKGEIHVSAV